MRLVKFDISGLFGLFDHEIEFHLGERLTIIHAPNGYGKTVILQLISNFFGGTFAVFRRIELADVRFHFDDKSILTIRQRPSPTSELSPSSDIQRIYSVEYVKGTKREDWDPWEETPEREPAHRVPLSAIERYIPYLVRVGPREWTDTRTNLALSYHEIIDRYGDRLPFGMRGPGRHPEWLAKIRSSVHCQLIETQRLMTLARRDERHVGTDQPTLVPVVRNYAADLATRLGRTLADSGLVAQSLDRTFPPRLLARLSETKPPPNEMKLRTQLTELEQQRARLAQVGLLDRSDEQALIPEGKLDAPMLRALDEYISDAQRKLASYTDVLVRVELLSELINSRFRFKKLLVDRESGFVFEDVLGRKLTADLLSSGEQHELVLLYDLIFRTREGSLILIDEPEISLHIAWQKMFLSDLRRIINLTPMDVVVSTHSPQLIGSNVDLMVQLKEPRKFGKQSDGRSGSRRGN